MEKKKSSKKKISIKKHPKKQPVEKTTSPMVWTPWDLFDTLDRHVWEDPWAPGWMRRWMPTSWPERWLESDTKISALDLVDTGKEFKVIAEVPGVSKKDLQVNITQNGLSICGETSTENKAEEKGYIRRERSYSTICRNITFPEEVNPDKAEANLSDGILEIKVAKKTPTKGRNIPIK